MSFVPVDSFLRKRNPNPPKKLQVILLRGTRRPDVETIWATLTSAIVDIFSNKQEQLAIEELYEAVHYLCRLKMGENLYQHIRKECEEHISVLLQSLVGQTEDLVGFLSHVGKCWEEFCDQMFFIRGMALWLDRTYVKDIPGVCSLGDMSFQLFRKHLSLSQVDQQIVFVLLKMIEKERLGEAVDGMCSYSPLKMFTALGIYSESFEKPFLDQTSDFYAFEGNMYMQKFDVPNYLKLVETRLAEEDERCQRYLEASTRKPLVAIVEWHLLGSHIAAILEKGFPMLMEGHCSMNLRRLYTLLSRVDALNSLSQALSSYIRVNKRGIATDMLNGEDVLSSLSELKSLLDSILEESFSKDQLLKNTIDAAFKDLVNLCQVSYEMKLAKVVNSSGVHVGEKGRLGNCFVEKLSLDFFGMFI